MFKFSILFFHHAIYLGFFNWKYFSSPRVSYSDQGWNTKICCIKVRVFSKENYLIYWNDAAELCEELRFAENSDKWRSFIDDPKVSLKVA